MASTQHNTNSSNTCVHIALEPGSSKTEQSARILAGCKHSLNFSLPFHIIINSTFPHTHPPSSFSSSVVCVTPSLLAHPLSQKSSSITTSPILCETLIHSLHTTTTSTSTCRPSSCPFCLSSSHVHLSN